MTTCFFITGTDTGVGKSMITAALLLGWTSAGKKTRFIKPAQTGIALGDDDTSWILEKTAVPADAALPPCYRLDLPASPDLAARHQGLEFSFERMVHTVLAAAHTNEVLLVEGAGGLLTPLDRTHTMLDLMLALSAQPVVVARSSLGTLNHTALTLQTLERAGRPPALLVVNNTSPVTNATEALVRDDNQAVLTRIAAPCPVVSIPWQPAINRDSLHRIGRQLVERCALNGLH